PPPLGGEGSDRRQPSLEHQPFARDAQRLVRRGDGDAAVETVRLDQLGAACLAVGVERRQRLPPEPPPPGPWSSSHTARPDIFNRASARRFFCPAERYWHGRSARLASPTAASA